MLKLDIQLFGGRGAVSGLKARDFQRSSPSLKINIQLFAAKRPEIKLPKKEYGKIVHEINTLYYSRYKNEKNFFHYSGDHRYKIKNISFNNYKIIAKKKIK